MSWVSPFSSHSSSRFGNIWGTIGARCKHSFESGIVHVALGCLRKNRVSLPIVTGDGRQASLDAAQRRWSGQRHVGGAMSSRIRSHHQNKLWKWMINDQGRTIQTQLLCLPFWNALCWPKFPYPSGISHSIPRGSGVLLRYQWTLTFDHAL